MRKIPTLFVRDEDDRRYVTEQVDPRCTWVFDGEGRATQKLDGTCCMLDEHGEWWARREVKPGKPEPADFVLIEQDPVTLKKFGWEPIGQSSFARWHAEALVNGEKEAGLAPDDGPLFEPGTYELVGPRINGNPERVDDHALLKHEYAMEIGVPELTFDGIRDLVLGLGARGMEGVVWKHPDGRMAKLKAKDLR